MRLSKQPLAAILTATWLLFGLAANVQAQSPTNIPDRKLDAAAAAIERVSSLKQSYQQKMAAASPSDKQRIANEASNAMVKAVTDQGLSVEEYNSIVEVAQNNPEVQQKLLQRLPPSAK